jgi:2-dehydro-3-deoxyphosphogluconate aldolase/(4S)-4-hydroxy-2-oxoglutarate aldolase
VVTSGDVIDDMESIFTRIAREGVLPVVVLGREEDAEPLADAIVAGGGSLVEITLRTPAALAAIRRLAARSDIVVGAGTVLTPEQAHLAQDAGARFIVAPGLDPPTVEAVRAAGLPIVPGVGTATEVQAAHRLGLRVVKFYPAASLGGPAAVRALAEVFRDMRFLPTGGVRADDLREYLRMPSVAACGGSWLAPADLIAAGDYGAITQRVRAALAVARAARARTGD